MAPTKQILVIEDSEINRDILTSILENEYSVLSAENGLVGLNLLKEHSDDISLILLDCILFHVPMICFGYNYWKRKKDDIFLFNAIM